eukprot:1153295-Pelagomonas_calceolata.AAC.4
MQQAGDARFFNLARGQAITNPAPVNVDADAAPTRAASHSTPLLAREWACEGVEGPLAWGLIVPAWDCACDVKEGLPRSSCDWGRLRWDRCTGIGCRGGVGMPSPFLNLGCGRASKVPGQGKYINISLSHILAKLCIVVFT